MVESEFRFLQVQVEGFAGDAVELDAASFGVTPEAFDAVDVSIAGGEFVCAVVDPEVLVKPESTKPRSLQPSE